MLRGLGLGGTNLKIIGILYLDTQIWGFDECVLYILGVVQSRVNRGGNLAVIIAIPLHKWWHHRHQPQVIIIPWTTCTGRKSDSDWKQGSLVLEPSISSRSPTISHDSHVELLETTTVKNSEDSKSARTRILTTRCHCGSAGQGNSNSMKKTKDSSALWLRFKMIIWTP